MPVFNQDIFGNSVLMKKLKQSQSGLYVNSTTDKSEIVNNSNINSGTEIIKTVTTSSNYLETNVDNIGTLMTTSSNTGYNPYSEHILFIKDPNGFAVAMNKNPQYSVTLKREQIGINVDLFKSLVSNPSHNGGLIYADQNVKVDCKIKFFQASNSDATGILGLMFNFIPISDNKLEEIEFQLTNYHTDELLNIQISKVKYPDYNISMYPQVLMKAQINDSFSTPATVYFNARLGMMNINTTFSLPLVITKYLEPLETSIENFTGMWYEYSNSSDEVFQKMDAILYNPMANNATIMDFLKKFGGLMSNLQFKVYPPLDKENFHELEGIAVLNYLDRSHSIPILFQASFVPSHVQEFRFSLRSKNTELERFSKLLLDIFSIVKFYINPA
jgi:hypothetical protein